jgi:uridine phosphorylase
MKNAVAHHTCSHWISMGMSSIEICHEHVFFVITHYGCSSGLMLLVLEPP